MTTGTIPVNHLSAIMERGHDVPGLNPANPMDNFHLMMPGYRNGTARADVYPAFLQKLEPFSSIRFMDWSVTNGSTQSNWSDRVPPERVHHGHLGGMPYEDMIELANESQKDMWINVPALATPSYIQSMAQLIHSKLDPNLNVYVEYSNETWNAGFPSAAKSTSWPIQPPGDAERIPARDGGAAERLRGGVDRQYLQAGLRFVQPRVRPIMAALVAGSQIATWQLQLIQNNYGPPSQYVWASAMAPYVSLPNGDNVAGLTVNQIFTDLNQYLTSKISPGSNPPTAVATCVRGAAGRIRGRSESDPGPNGLNFAVMEQAQNKPRMYQLYLALDSAWAQNGRKVYEDFQLDAGPGGGFLGCS